MSDGTADNRSMRKASPRFWLAPSLAPRFWSPVPAHVCHRAAQKRRDRPPERDTERRRRRRTSRLPAEASRHSTGRSQKGPLICTRRSIRRSGGSHVGAPDDEMGRTGGGTARLDLAPTRTHGERTTESGYARSASRVPFSVCVWGVRGPNRQSDGSICSPSRYSGGSVPSSRITAKTCFVSPMQCTYSRRPSGPGSRTMTSFVPSFGQTSIGSPTTHRPYPIKWGWAQCPH